MYYLRSFDVNNASFANAYFSQKGDFLIDFNTLRATPQVRKIVILTDDEVIKGNHKVISVWKRKTHEQKT